MAGQATINQLMASLLLMIRHGADDVPRARKMLQSLLDEQELMTIAQVAATAQSKRQDGCWCRCGHVLDAHDRAGFMNRCLYETCTCPDYVMTTNGL